MAEQQEPKPQKHDSSFELKLQKSGPVASLMLEAQVASAVASKGWSVVHGCYYEDVDTKKAREVDVVGKRHWVREKEGVEQHAWMNIVIECKSASGWHLVFWPTTGTFANTLFPYWFGARDPETRDRIAELLGQQFVPTIAGHVLRSIEAISLDSIIVPSDFRVLPPRAPLNASAFRETNLGSEKDLDNGVMWRSGLVLDSVRRSFRERTKESHVQWIRTAIDMAHAEKKEPSQAAFDAYRDRLRTTFLFHPVLVIDAPLWTFDSGKLTSAKWCRFQQRELSGQSDWWFDVVHYSYLENYLADVTEHYDLVFRVAGGKRIGP